GSLDVTADSSMTTDFGAPARVRVLSAGTITRSSGSGVATINAEVTNDGSISASSGTLNLGGGDGTGSSTGSFGGTAPAEVGFIGGAFDLNTGSSFTGRVGIGGGVVNIDGTTSSTPTGRIRMYGGTLGGPGTLTLHGASTWTSGTMTDAGTTAIATDGSLAINGDVALRGGHSL